MSESSNLDVESEAVQTVRDFTELRGEAEIMKLHLEAEELQERINRGKRWYTGRYLFEAIIGGLVAGALFVSWFIGFYSPSIEIQKDLFEIETVQQKAEFDLELGHLKHALQTEQMQLSIEKTQNDELLRKHLEFNQFVTDGHSYLLDWAEGFSKRIDAQISPLDKGHDNGFNTKEIEVFLTYLEKESEKLDQVRSLLEIDVSRGNILARQLLEGINVIDNSDFNITIVYDRGLEDLAYQARDALLTHKFNARKPERWVKFREGAGDGDMARYFKDGPVLWYNRNHKRTDEKINTIKNALTKIFPENMTLRRGDTLVVPGITWNPPGEYNVQLWLFQKH